MTLNEFMQSLAQPIPPIGLTKPLEALWFDGKDDWNTAHDVAQEINSSEGSWIHAYLHRKEGDHENAAYWYRRAGRPVPRVTLEEEWKQIVTELLTGT